MINLSNAKLDSHLESEGFQILEVNYWWIHSFGNHHDIEGYHF